METRRHSESIYVYQASAIPHILQTNEANISQYLLDSESNPDHSQIKLIFTLSKAFPPAKIHKYS